MAWKVEHGVRRTKEKKVLTHLSQTHKGTLISEICRRNRPRDRIEISGKINIVAGRSFVVNNCIGEATRVP